MGQFRDNILIASSYPDSAHTQVVHKICGMLGKAWALRVLCDCQSEHTQCQGTCHSSCVTAMGFCMVRGAMVPGLLTYTPIPSHHPGTSSKGHQGPARRVCYNNIHRGCGRKCAVWCTTWAGQILSISARCQVAVLFGYPHEKVARWAHSAIQRAYSITRHSSEKTAGYIH